jgi:hypothetical protein
MCSLVRYSVDKANGHGLKVRPKQKKSAGPRQARRNPFRGRVVRRGLRAEGCPTLRSRRHAASADLHLHPFIYSRDKRPAGKPDLCVAPVAEWRPGESNEKGEVMDGGLWGLLMCFGVLSVIVAMAVIERPKRDK